MDGMGLITVLAGSATWTIAAYRLIARRPPEPVPAPSRQAQANRARAGKPVGKPAAKPDAKPGANRAPERPGR
jgi:hypothetical protein